MPNSCILDSTSFATLDDAGQNAVRTLYDESYLPGKKLALDHLQLFRQSQSLADAVTFCEHQLNGTNVVKFQFMNDAQLDALEEELLFSFYVLSAQYQLHEVEHRRQDLPHLSNQIKKNAFLINEIRKRKQKKTPETLLLSAIDDSEKHLKYLGVTLVAPMVIDALLDFIDEENEPSPEEWDNSGQTGVVKEWMGIFNGRRLYWVWCGNFLSTVIGLIPDEFANKPQAEWGVQAPLPVTGYISWVLYFVRFGINLGLLLKHTIAGPWMSEEERQIPFGERFNAQWQQRKFALLNDSLWGLINMACFLWLIGKGLLGYLGNVVTTGLLLMDVVLTVWRFYEEDTKHHAEILRFERDIDELRQKINALNEEEEERLKLSIQLDALIQSKKRCELEWQYKKYALVNDLSYAAALLISFALMVSFLFPPAALAPATALILGVLGAALCFVITAVYSAVSEGLGVAKAQEISRMNRCDVEVLLVKFSETTDELVKKQLYLDMKQLMADSLYQDRLSGFQKMKLVRVMLVDLLVPPLIFVSLMFMPLGIGLAVIAAGFALAITSYLILNRFEPSPDQLPEFDEAMYKAFASKPVPMLDDLVSLDKASTVWTPEFFDKGGPEKTGGILAPNASYGLDPKPGG